MQNPRPPNAEEERRKAEAAELMVQDRVRLVQRQPFVGHLAMHLEPVPVIDRRMTTACTDGRRLFMDAEFYCRMDPEERLGVLGHEVWHCALRHFARKGTRDRQKFNFASDVEVDLLLRRAGFKVEILPYDPSWPGKSAEQIYDLMFPGMERFRKDDEHLYPEDLPQNSRSPGGGSGESLPSDDDGDDDGDADDPGSAAGDEVRLPRVSHDGVADPDFQPGFDADVSDDWNDHLRNAVQQERKRGGKGIGSLPGNVEDLVRDDTRSSTVDWKQVLLEYVTQFFGGERQWLPPARRYVWKKLYLPSRARKQSIEIVLAIDTSGSTTADLPDFLAELRGMADAFGEYKLTVIQCDIGIHSVAEYSNDDPLPEIGLKFRGFGGTSFHAPFRYVEERMPEPPTVFIYLTDGLGDAPRRAPDYPVIWCLTGGGQKPAEWGLEVRIGKKDPA